MTDTTTTTVAQPDDLDYDLAYRAHANTSHVPEQRARTEQQSYADDVNRFAAAMQALCTSERQQQVLADELSRYKATYLAKYGAVLAARSRTASPMITGPAKFPTRRNQQRIATEDRRRKEFDAWRHRAQAAVRKTILAARTVQAERQQQAANPQADTVIAQGDDWKVEVAPSDDRVRIWFDAKPDAATRTRLKAEGWRWAPSVGAWQRKLTQAATMSATRLMRQRAHERQASG